MNKFLSPTELLKPSSKTIDQLSMADSLSFMVDDHFEAVQSVKNNIQTIESIITDILNHINDKSKFIYVGAGTSGRIAVQDGSELYPTFGWPKNNVRFLIAGGFKSLLESVEYAEDNQKQAILDFENNPITKNDIIFALAASGNTSYTLKIAELAKKNNAIVVGIVNNPNSYIKKFCSHLIFLNTGPEVLAGSTRLKAGTSQKICLNLISTSIMMKLGRVKNGQMINMVVTNNKLKERKKRIDLSLKKNY